MKIIAFLTIAVAPFFMNVDFSLAQTDNPSKRFIPVSEMNLRKNVTLNVGESNYYLSESEIESWITEKEDFIFDGGYHSEIENGDFCPEDSRIICSLTGNSSRPGHIRKISLAIADSEKINNFLDDLDEQTRQEPENAKLQIENGKVSFFSLSKTGLSLEKEKSLEVILNYLKNGSPTDSLGLPYVEIQPEISNESADNLGINSLIGEGRSNFRGSPKNRIFNIKVATDRFNGVLIKPGEEFSFVKILGEVDGEHGYRPELVIKKDKTEPEFGGGVCQVSTTAFRAAIYSGLKITARRNHAYPVQYYNPQGMDATIYVPRPDLRFVNNTPGYILIQTKIEGTELIFQFFGTDDGRKTNVLGPKITEKNPDGSMKTTFTQQVYDKNSGLLFEDVFNSKYDSPSKFPHPGGALTEKPQDWSKKQWADYKKEHGA